VNMMLLKSRRESLPPAFSLLSTGASVFMKRTRVHGACIRWEICPRMFAEVGKRMLRYFTLTHRVSIERWISSLEESFSVPIGCSWGQSHKSYFSVTLLQQSHFYANFKIIKILIS